MDTAQYDERYDDPPNPILQSEGGLAESVYQALTNGNRAVFEDIYPAHLFYQKYAIAAMKSCQEARNPPLPKKVLDGFADIDAGQSARGALKILEQEQLRILQQANVFGNETMRHVMEMKPNRFPILARPRSWRANDERFLYRRLYR